MAFIKISLPPMDKNFSFHPISFFPTLSFISLKACFFDLLIIEGRPRYFVGLASYIGLRLSFTSALFSSSIFLLKNTEDLFVLIF